MHGCCLRVGMAEPTLVGSSLTIATLRALHTAPNVVPGTGLPCDSAVCDVRVPPARHVLVRPPTNVGQRKKGDTLKKRLVLASIAGLIAAIAPMTVAGASYPGYGPG